MPESTRRHETPVLVVIGCDGKPEILNYRVKGSMYIADRIFDRAQLVIGSGKKSRRSREYSVFTSAARPWTTLRWTKSVSSSKSKSDHLSGIISLARRPRQPATQTCVLYGSGRRGIRENCAGVRTRGALSRFDPPRTRTRAMGLRSMSSHLRAHSKIVCMTPR